MRVLHRLGHNVDAIECTNDIWKAYLSVLLGRIDSPHWHLRLVVKKRRPMEYITAVPEDLPPLRRYLNNPELMDVVADVEGPPAMDL